MSASQNLGSLSTKTGTFYFATATTPTGAIPEEPVLLEEELRDQFIDGTRFRDESYQFQEFTMDTTEDYTSDGAGYSLYASYLKAAGSFATLTFVRNGTRYTYKNVKVRGCVPSMAPGQLIGYGASSQSAGVLRATWVLRLTERRLSL
jgi:hypothetical protein